MRRARSLTSCIHSAYIKRNRRFESWQLQCPFLVCSNTPGQPPCRLGFSSGLHSQVTSSVLVQSGVIMLGWLLRNYEIPSDGGHACCDKTLRQVCSQSKLAQLQTLPQGPASVLNLFNEQVLPTFRGEGPNPFLDGSYDPNL